MLKATGWKVQGRKKQQCVSPDGSETFEVERRMNFVHARMTSGVVVKNKATGERRVFIKGATQKILSLLKSGRDCELQEESDSYARDGFYVICMATKTLARELSTLELSAMTRDELEEDLQVCGFLLFRNEPKTDSLQAIEQLKLGSVKCLMCTGDNAFTGVVIARKCGLITSDSVLI